MKPPILTDKQKAVVLGDGGLPSIEEQRRLILRWVRRIQPCTWSELLGVTNLSDTTLTARVDEMLASRELMEARGVSRAYYSIYREVRP